jgi:hypothetical protein
MTRPLELLFLIAVASQLFLTQSLAQVKKTAAKNTDTNKGAAAANSAKGCAKIKPPASMGGLTAGQSSLNGCADGAVKDVAVAKVVIGVIAADAPKVTSCMTFFAASPAPKPAGQASVSSKDAVVEFKIDLPSPFVAGEQVCIEEVDAAGKPLAYSEELPVGAAASGDSEQLDASAFQLITGVGAVVAGDEFTSYSTNMNVLEAANIGRKTPEVLLGAAFILPWKRGGFTSSYCADNSDKCDDPAYINYRPWEAFISVRFAPGTDQTVNGLVVGGGYRITKYLSLLVGYSATPTNEPGPGFRTAAAQAVASNSTIFPYKNFNPTALQNNNVGAFDGFPLLLYNSGGPTATPVFLGNPTITHFRSGIFFGVGIPINVGKLFQQ